MAHHARSGVSVDRPADSASASNSNSRSLAIWLNGYVNGARGKTLVDPLSVGENNLIDYCVSHTNTLVLEAARNLVGADK